MKKDPSQMSDEELAKAIAPGKFRGCIAMFIVGALAFFMLVASFQFGFGIWGVIGLWLVLTISQPIVKRFDKVFQSSAEREFYKRFPDMRDFPEVLMAAQELTLAPDGPDYIAVFQGTMLPGGGKVSYVLELRESTTSGTLRESFRPFYLKGDDKPPHQNTIELADEDAKALIELFESSSVLAKNGNVPFVGRDGFPFQICFLTKQHGKRGTWSGHLPLDVSESENPAIQIALDMDSIAQKGRIVKRVAIPLS